MNTTLDIIIVVLLLALIAVLVLAAIGPRAGCWLRGGEVVVIVDDPDPKWNGAAYCREADRTYMIEGPLMEVYP